MASGRIRKSLSGNVDEALRLFSERSLWADLNVAETEFVLEEALKCYGSVQVTAYIAELFALYRRYMGMADVNRRQALLSRMTEFVSDGRQNRAMALLCFIASDTDGQIISGAALDLAMILPTEKDPLAGPKLVAMHSCGGLRSMTGGEPTPDEGHAAAGLLLLGDARLLPILKDIWGRLSVEGRNNMIKRRSGLAYMAIAEFALQRLEEDGEEVHFGELGALLHDLARIAEEGTRGFVLDARRNFGLPPGKEPMELLERLTVAEFYRRIEPRLRKLIARESTPKVLPAVLSRWAEAAGVEQEGAEAKSPKPGKTICISEELGEEYESHIGPHLDQVAETAPIVIWFNPYSFHSHVSAAALAEELAAGKAFPLLLTGQFNPLCPAITCYVVRTDLMGEWGIWVYVLTPFRCTSTWVAAIDNEDINFEVGQFDEAASSSRKTLVFEGRDGGDGAYLLRLLVDNLLSRSRLLPGFTLCHCTSWLKGRASFDLVCALHKAKKNGARDTEWLRDEALREDPWGRMDHSLAMELLGGERMRGRELSMGDTLEFATRALTPSQQKIEFDNIVAAWDGAITLRKGDPVVLDRASLMRLMLNLTPDMPGLLGAVAVEKSSRGRTVPASPRRTKSVPSPETARSAESAIKPKIPGELASFPKQDDKGPKLNGLPALIYYLSALEVLLSIVALTWALFTKNWLLACVIPVFGFMNLAKIGMMEPDPRLARWWGLLFNTLMAGFVLYRLQVYGRANHVSDSSIMLHKVILCWVGFMALLHLISFIATDRTNKDEGKPEA